MKKSLIMLFILLVVVNLYSQGIKLTDEKKYEPPVKLTTEQDHQRMMKLLGIDSLRPGRNGMNPKAANYANYDEAKANPFSILPELMTLKMERKLLLNLHGRSEEKNC